MYMYKEEYDLALLYGMLGFSSMCGYMLYYALLENVTQPFPYLEQKCLNAFWSMCGNG